MDLATKKMQTSAKKLAFNLPSAAFFCKENANERKESLLSICRVQLFFCKDTTFLNNKKIIRKSTSLNFHICESSVYHSQNKSL